MGWVYSSHDLLAARLSQRKQALTPRPHAPTTPLPLAHLQPSQKTFRIKK